MLHPLIIYLYRELAPPLPRKCLPNGAWLGECACVDNKTIIPPCLPELWAKNVKTTFLEWQGKSGQAEAVK